MWIRILYSGCRHLNLWQSFLVFGMSTSEGLIMVTSRTHMINKSFYSITLTTYIGLHEFYYSSNYILILNVFRPNDRRIESSKLKTYKEYLPSEVYILDPNYFQKSKIKTGKNEKIFKANKADESCNTVWHVGTRTIRFLLPHQVFYGSSTWSMHDMDIIGRILLSRTYNTKA